MPLTFADPSASDDLASQNLATGTPTGFMENLQAGWAASRAADVSNADDMALSDQYAKYNQQVFETTGLRLPNPIEDELPPGVSRDDVLGIGGDDPRIQIPRPVLVQQYEDYAHKLGANPPSATDMVNAAHAQMYGAQQTAQNVGSRASGEFGGQFLGSMAATMTDPPVLASMMFPAGEAETFLGAVGREALVAGGTEAAIQPQIQSQRIAAGLPGGFTQGAENVGMAALGAAGLTSLFHGGAAAYGALRDSAADYLASGAGDAATQDAARYTERYSDLQSQNPLAETPAGIAEHVDRTSASQSRLYDPMGDVPETRIPDDPVSPVVQTASADPTEAPTETIAAGAPN